MNVSALTAERVHVLPVNDLKPHIEAGEWCHCAPRVDGDLVIHNAYDGREFYEQEAQENETH